MYETIGGIYSMNQFEQQYNERKNTVVNYLNDVITLLENQQKDDIAKALMNLKKNVEHNLFSIVLVGEFSAGKSTFLNALMHKKILPSFTSETTATVNFLRHKEEAPNGEAGIVYYNDGRTEVLPDLSLKTIEQVVSTRGDKGEERVATTIDHVDLFLESDFLKKGVMLVDSPGLNGVADNHREITEKQIKASHASIFMFSADHPGSKTDFEFVRDLREQYGSQSNNIFYVLNKIDAVRKSEGQSIEGVIEDLKKSYAKQFPEDMTMPPIYPIAGFAALVARDKDMKEYIGGEVIKSQQRRDELEQFSRMEDFEARLWKYLTEGERTKAQLLEPINTSIAELNEQRKLLEEQKELLEGKESSEELIKQKEFLEQKIEDLQKEKKQVVNPLSMKISTIIKESNEDIKAQCINIENRIQAEIEPIEDVEELNLYAQNLVKYLDSKYKRIAQNIDNKLKDDLLMAVQEECSEYFSEINNGLLEISNNSVLKTNIGKFNLGEIQINNDLEKEETELKMIKEKMSELRKKVSGLEEDSIEAQELEAELGKKEEELYNLRNKKSSYISNFIVPDIHYKTEQEWKEGSRGGLLGGLAYILVGSKKELVNKEVADTRARDIAIADRDKYLSELDNETKRLEDERKNMKTSLRSSKVIEIEIRNNMEQIKDLQTEYEEKQKKIIENMRENSAKACRKMTRNINNYTEDCSDKFISSASMYLISQQKNYVEFTKNIFERNINQKMNEQKQRLDKVLELINTEGKERDEQLSAVNNGIEKIKDLQNKGIEIKTDLEEGLNDTIEQEVL